MSLDEWEKCKIRDIVTVKRGSSPRPIKDFLTEEGIPWVKIADATSTNSRFITSTGEYIKKEGIKNSVKVFKGDLIVSNSATPGLPKFMGIDACVHDGWLIFDNYNGVLKDFLYYFFIWTRKKLVNQANGTIFKNLKTDIVKNFDIRLPPIPTQTKIIHILSTIDKNIENLSKINSNLISQLVSIYQHWFFDFVPFKDQKFIPSELGDIPDGWRVDKLENVIEILDSKRIPLSGKERESMDKIYPYYGASSLMDYVGDYIFDGIYLLIGEDGTVITDNGYPILQYVWGKFWVNNHAHIIKGINGFSTELLFILLQKTKVRHLVTGAVQPKINQKNLKNLKIIIPPNHCLNKFNKIIEPIFDLYRNNVDEISRLEKLRDTLLPKLMSGEIDVSGIKIG